MNRVHFSVLIAISILFSLTDSDSYFFNAHSQSISVDEDIDFDIFDLFWMGQNWMKETTPGENGDLNHNGIIDLGDLIQFIQEYNEAANSDDDEETTPHPTISPTAQETSTPILTPTVTNTPDPSTPTIFSPTNEETLTPTIIQTLTPTENPSSTPTLNPAEATPTSLATMTITHTPSIMPTATIADSTTTLTPTSIPTPTLISTPTNTVFPTETPSPTGTILPTTTSTPSATASPTESATVEITPTATVPESETPSPTSLFTFTPTPTRTPSVHPSASPTSIGDSTDVTPTPTASQPANTPTLTPTPTPATPTFTPTPSLTPTPMNTPAPVRQWNIHRALSLFTKPVEVPSSSKIASSSLGYAVYTQSEDNALQFISFDRFGRIYRRTLSISQNDFSGLAFTNGGLSFGQFFENPAATRRFRFERFNLDNIEGNMIDVDHLGADAIRWAFGGSENGFVMAILRHPDIITLHYISTAGDYLGKTEFNSSVPLPTNPHVLTVEISDGIIGVLYSSNWNAAAESAAPLFLWLVDWSGNVLTEYPINIPLDLIGKAIVGDGLGRFFLAAKNNFGARLYRISVGGIEFQRVLQLGNLIDIEWQDEMVWVLDGSNHTLSAFDEEGILDTGPVGIYPPNWQSALQWIDLEKSGPDLGAFFTDYANRESVYYMQVEAGAMVTPTPTPASGVPTGATISVELGEDIGLEMIQISKGTYTRGSPEDEVGRSSNEGPPHLVTLTYDFFISKYEITNQLYLLFEPDHTIPSVGTMQQDLDHLPAVNVSWKKANEFCQWLSDETQYTFSLPTEAEWEYVCRAGSQTRRPWGVDADDEEICSMANAADISSTTEFFFKSLVPCNDGYPGLAPVGSFPPNAFGIHDMMGNVWEWCEDYFVLYNDQPLTDPRGPTNGLSRVFRGGSWQEGPGKLRSANRSAAPPDEIHPALGFRVVIRE